MAAMPPRTRTTSRLAVASYVALVMGLVVATQVLRIRDGGGAGSWLLLAVAGTLGLICLAITCLGRRAE